MGGHRWPAVELLVGGGRLAERRELFVDLWVDVQGCYRVVGLGNRAGDAARTQLR